MFHASHAIMDLKIVCKKTTDCVVLLTYSSVIIISLITNSSLFLYDCPLLFESNI